MKFLYLVLLLSFSAMGSGGIDSGGSGTGFVKPGEELIINPLFGKLNDYGEVLKLPSNILIEDFFNDNSIRESLNKDELNLIKTKLLKDQLRNISEITLRDGTVINFN